MEQLITEKELCEQLQLGRSTVRRLMAQGALRPVKIGRSLRFPAKEAERYVRELQNGGVIPEFESYEQEAEYWDNFDSSTLPESAELGAGEAPLFKRPLVHNLSVRLESEDMRRLGVAAQALGVGVTTMARILLRRALAKAEAKG